MPPKKKEQPKASKVAVDKTFGLKNVRFPEPLLQRCWYIWWQKNKSKKVQQFVQQVQQQQAATGVSAKAKVVIIAMCSSDSL